MKNRYVKKVLRLILFGAVFVGSLVFIGCRDKKISEYKATRIMKEKLCEKYNKEFVVLEAEEMACSSDGMPPILSEYRYYADAYFDDETQLFKVSLDEYGDNFEDEYCKIIFEEPLKKYIYDSLAEIEGIKINEYKAVFFMDSYQWSENDDVEKFLKQTDTYICLHMEVNAETVEEVAQICYDVSEVLEERDVQAYMWFRYEGVEVNICTPIGRESEQEFIDSIKKQLEAKLEKLGWEFDNLDKSSPVEVQDETENK